jgi:multidrug efflux system membrane fusion protein
VTVQQFASQPTTGAVTRTASAIDPASRTLLTEVQIANPKSTLLPGMYAQVEFDNLRSEPPFLVPGETLIVRSNGTQLAVLVDPTDEDRRLLQQRISDAAASNQNRDGAPDGGASANDESRQVKRLHLQTVQIGRDYGTEIEITGGLQGWERVVVNPGDTVEEGALIVPHDAPAARAQKAGPIHPAGDKAPGGISSPSEAAPSEGPATGRGGRGQGGQRGKSQQGGRGSGGS